jgi:AbrB family transcriptional regulator (stage V sporulation protein T)
MKATGIVRRIDDLGRVVIPKEIRRTMRIREGDPLEIYTDREGEVIFKKYSPIGEMNSFAAQYAETLYKTCEMAVVICDRDSIIAAAGVPKRDFLEKPINPEAEVLMEHRNLYQRTDAAPPIMIVEGKEWYVSCAMPMITDGDIVGCVASLASEKAPRGLQKDVEERLIRTAAAFLSKQLEG